MNFMADAIVGTVLAMGMSNLFRKWFRIIRAALWSKGTFQVLSVDLD